jgi:hypothetical protein
METLAAAITGIFDAYIALEPPNHFQISIHLAKSRGSAFETDHG